jgi:predicted NAD/FAD-binding protein
LLSDVVRFNRAARELARTDTPDDRSLGQLVDALGLSPGFLDWYLVPMGAAIWSADPTTVTAMPASTMARFFDTHGLLQLGGRPRWRTVTGGSARYVETLVGRLRGRVHAGTGVDAVVRGTHGVELCTTGGERRTFDHVVLAVHSDQALRLLAHPTRREQEILGAIRYQPNRALLHTDTRLLPRTPHAWASWNYRRPVRSTGKVAVTYLMNRLHRARWPVPVLVTLNQDEEIHPATVLAEATYHHPVIDGPAVAAQRRHGEIDGRDRVSFAGAYWGNGFHEDGLQSAVRVCRSLGSEVPW